MLYSCGCTAICCLRLPPKLSGVPCSMLLYICVDFQSRPRCINPTSIYVHVGTVLGAGNLSLNKANPNTTDYLIQVVVNAAKSKGSYENE